MSTLSPGKKLAVIAALAMAGAVAAGLYVLGSPTHQRQLRWDSNRVSALSVLSIAIHAYWVQHHVLPTALSDLAIEERWVKDPVTAQPYGYKPLDADAYSVCASFATDSRKPGAENLTPRLYGPTQQGWQHPAGRYCFHFMADVHQDLRK